MKKSIGKLICAPNQNYFFDAVVNQIVPLSDNSFEQASRLLQGEGCEVLTGEIQELIEQGFFSDSPVEKIVHPYEKYLPLILSRTLNHITLQVTQNCNLRCKYCIYSVGDGANQRHHSAKRMDWQTAKRAVDFLWEHSIDSDEISIGFYGGEPLLERPLLEKVVEYANERFEGKCIKYNITTNGTLLNDENISFLAENQISLMVSLDGPKLIHDRNRVFPDGKGSFDVVMERISRVKLLYPEYAKHMSFSMVMDPENDFDCINQIHLDGSVITKYNLRSTFVERIDENANVSMQAEENFFEKFSYQEFLAWLSYLGRYPIEKVSAISYQALLHSLGIVFRSRGAATLQKVDCPSGSCIVGKQRLFCSIDGTLFPCERINECSQAMHIGNIFSGLDIEQALHLLKVGSLTPEECKKCWAFRFCSLCAKKADIGERNLSEAKKLSACVEAKSNAFNALRNWVLDLELRENYREQLIPVTEEEL